jgi:hypothetical protein
VFVAFEFEVKMDAWADVSCDTEMSRYVEVSLRCRTPCNATKFTTVCIIRSQEAFRKSLGILRIYGFGNRSED